MFDFLILLWLASWVVIVIAFINPNIFTFLFRKSLSRKQAGLTAIGISLLIFLSMFPFVPPDNSTSSASSSKTKPTVTAKKEVATPTPTGKTPTCDVATMDGTQFDLCLRHYFPLTAVVKTDGISLFITNPQTVDWTGCNVESSDGVYMMNGYDSFDIQAGGTESLGWGRLTDESGNRLNYLQKQPGPINITCFIGKQQYEGQFQGF